jgi:hypothetical protein
MIIPLISIILKQYYSVHHYLTNQIKFIIIIIAQFFHFQLNLIHYYFEYVIHRNSFRYIIFL